MVKRRAAALLVGLVLAGGSILAQSTRTQTYAADHSAFANAQMGYAPAVRSREYTDVTLRYLQLTWRQVEPEPGQYDWQGIEEAYGLAALREQGVHLVLRFVCDEPSKTQHLDIPDWLYERTGNGSWYTTDYGSGYSPDYADPVFRAAHKQVLAALGRQFGTDGFVSYVELGSLGHWGEWHIKTEDGLVPMPEEAIRDEYAQHTLAAFPQAKVIMRRPFNIAAREGLGLYNDMTGDAADTQEWLDWIGQGGWYGQEPRALAAMPEFWRTAPAGGEFTSATDMQTLLSTQLPRTLALIRQSHMSFLGPKIANPAYRAGYQAVLKELGYRLRVTTATLSAGENGSTLTLTLRNEGNAPFYWDWSVNLYVEDVDGNTLETQRLPLRLSTLQPGTEQTASAVLQTVQKVSSLHSGRRITLGITDPMTDRDAVRFAMKAEQENGRTLLFQNVG